MRGAARRRVRTEPVSMSDAGKRGNRGKRTRAVSIAPADTAVRYGGDGTVYMLSRHRLGAYPNRITERLAHWAERAPDRTFVAQRDATGLWRRVSYAQTLTRVRRLSQALVDRRLSIE